MQRKRRGKRWIAAILCTAIVLQNILPGELVNLSKGVKAAEEEAQQIDLREVGAAGADNWEKAVLTMKDEGKRLHFSLALRAGENAEEVRTETVIETETVVERESEIGTEIETWTETETEAGTGIETETETGTGIETEAETETETGTGIESETETEAETGTGIETETETGTENGTGAEIKTGAETAERIAVEADYNFHNAAMGEVKELKQAREEFSLSLEFQGSISVIEGETDGSIEAQENLDGEYTLSQAEEGVFFNVEVNLPKVREEGVELQLDFMLEKKFENALNAVLVWDEQDKLIKIEKDFSNAVSLMQSVQTYALTKTALEETQKEITVDLKNDITASGFIKGMYQSFELHATTTRGTNQITVDFQAKMSDDYFQEQFERYVTEYMSDHEDYNKEAFVVWLKAQTEGKIPPITFSYTFEGFTLPKNGSTTKEFILDNVNIGTYTLTQTAATDAEEASVTMTGVLDPILYTMTGVSFGGNFQLNSVLDIGEKEIPVLENEKGKIVCDTKETMYLEGEPSPDSPYALNKTIIQNDDSSPYVSFAIDVEGYQPSEGTEGGCALAGITIEDILPANLLLTKLEVAYDDENHTKTRTQISASQTEGDGGYTLQGNKIEYTFPNTPSGYLATLYVETTLTPESMGAMLKSGGRTSFENKAAVKGITNKDGSPIEAQVSGDKQFEMFSKMGVQDEANGSIFHWTIDVDAFYYGSVNFYLVDSLDTTSHNYVLGSLKVNVGTLGAGGNFNVERTENIPLQALADTSAAAGENIAYGSVTAETLAKLNPSGAGGFVYSSTGTEKVMALRLDTLMSAHEKKHFQICYDTVMTKDSSDADNTELTFNNYADLRWKEFHYGIGPGEYEWDFEFNLDKPATASVNAVKKKAIAYDEKNQLLTWDLAVNYYGADYAGDLIIEEDLSDSTTQMLPNPIYCEIAQVHRGSKFHTGSILSGTSASTAPYYEIDGKKLKIHLGNVSAEDYFTIQVKTKAGGDITAVQAGESGNKVINTVKAYVNTPPASGGFESTAETYVPNTLIEKKAVGTYDQTTRALSWKTTVNPNSLAIANGKIEDRLPEGNTFGQLQKVTYGSQTLDSLALNGESGSNSFTIDDITMEITKEADGSYVLDSNTDNNEKVTFTVTNGELTKPLILEYTTQLTKEHIDNIFSDSGIEHTKVADGIYSNAYVNHVQLTGNIKDTTKNTLTVISNAKDQAAHTVKSPILHKNGEYGTKGNGVITWSAVVNAPGADLNGMQIEEQLNMAYQEYREKTLTIKKISNVSVNGSGGYTYTTGEVAFDASAATVTDGVSMGTSGGNEIKVTYLTGTVNAAETGTDNYITDTAGRGPGGFTIEFATGDTASYLVTFETAIVADATAADLKNQMECIYNGKEIFSSNDADSGLTGKFSVNNYVTGSQIPVLMMEKKSSTPSPNSTEAITENLLNLANAKFKLYEVEWTGSAYVQKTEIRIKSTMENGKRLFVNMEQDKMYALYEEKAPAGYEKEDKPWFIFFKDKQNVTDEQKSWIATNGNSLTTGSKLFLKASMTNTPFVTSVVEFTKVNNAGTGIEGIKFKLEDKAGKLKAFEAISDTNGKVIFTGVDPGVYTLKEVVNANVDGDDTTKADDKYALLSEVLTVEVKGTETGATYTITSNAPAGSVLSGAMGNYQIKNSLVTGSLEITKKDSRTKKVMEGVSYTLKGVDAEGKFYGGSEDGVTATTSKDKGQVTFSKIPVGEYELTETYPPAYQQATGQEKARYKVIVTAKETAKAHQSIVSVERIDETDNTLAPKPGVGNTTTTEQVNDNTVQSKVDKTAQAVFENTPLSGSITFIKNGILRDGATKSGQKNAVFGLFANKTVEATQANAVKNEKNEPAVAESTEDGTVVFEGIYAGQVYYIREITPPTGFFLGDGAAEVDLTAAALSKLTADSISYGERVEATAGERTFTYTLGTEKQTLLDNHLVEASLAISKTDQNGQPLSDIKFSVYRFGAEDNFTAGDEAQKAKTITADDGQWTAYTLSEKSGSALPHETVTDNAGVAALGKLEYGIYKFVETVPEDKVVSPPAPFYIQIVESGGEVKAYRYETIEALLAGYGSGAIAKDCIEIVLEKAAGNSYSGTLAVKNSLKYGLIQVKKVAAVINGGSEVALLGGTDNPTPVKGAKFALYRESDVENAGGSYTVKDSAKAFVIIETNAQGKFAYSEKGEYTNAGNAETTYGGDKVKLLLGDWYLQESETPDGYLRDTTVYKVTLQSNSGDSYGDDSSADNLSITYAGNTAGLTGDVADRDGHPYFINQVVRTGMQLTKVDKDADTKCLSGAEFVVKNSSKKTVASLKEKEGEDGVYVLSNEIPPSQRSGSQTNYNEKNEDGMNYLELAEGEYKLLSGTYTVQEVKAPAGYKRNFQKGDGTYTDSVEVNVSGSTAVVVSNDGTDTFKNEAGRIELCITKQIVDVNGAAIAYDNGWATNCSDFKFEITQKLPENPDITWNENIPLTGADAAAKITLPFGVYTIAESALTYVEKNSMNGMYVQPEEKSLLVTEEGIFEYANDKKGNELGKDAGGTYLLPMQNRLLTGKLEGKKAGIQTLADGTERSFPLAGATFGLYRDASASQPVKGTDGNDMTAVSGGTGSFSFTNVPYSSSQDVTYYIKEISTLKDFAVDTNVYAVKMEAVNPGQAELTESIKNTYSGKTITLELNLKSTEGKSIAKTKFILYAQNAEGKMVYMEATTDAKGNIIFEGIIALEGFDYEIVQADTVGNYEKYSISPSKIPGADLVAWADDPANTGKSYKVRAINREPEADAEDGGAAQPTDSGSANAQSGQTKPGKMNLYANTYEENLLPKTGGFDWKLLLLIAGTGFIAYGVYYDRKKKQ